MRIDRDISVAEIEDWLRDDDAAHLETLWHAADETRHKIVGDAVHFRGLIEISNYCVRSCAYCGLRRENAKIDRYRMNAEEIMRCAYRAVAMRYGTVVIQSGEDYGVDCEWLASVIERIKAETPLAVTLGMGERSFEELRMWREAGADRYLLRFETSDVRLYEKIHPDMAGTKSDRIALLRVLRSLGYETGGGVMIGMPGQNYTSLARDIAVFRREDFDMIGVGPFIANPDTPLGLQGETDGVDQIRATDVMAYKVIALTRLVCPRANIPATTALSVVNTTEGRVNALACGANVIMPNITPVEYRKKYAIYPNKACAEETAEVCAEKSHLQIATLGCSVGTGRGDAIRLA